MERPSTRKEKVKPFVPNQIVIVEVPPCKLYGEYPWHEGDHLLYIGEIVNMPDHVIVADHHGHIHWGYHLENFRHPTEDEI